MSVSEYVDLLLTWYLEQIFFQLYLFSVIEDKDFLTKTSNQNTAWLRNTMKK